MNKEGFVPGWPGIPPRWTSSAKSGVGTALNQSSRVWFTLSHGIFDEIYYPRLDQACTRDMGLIVTDGKDFFSEEKRQTAQQIEPLEKGVPAFKLTNTCLSGRYRIEKEILADPRRDVILQRTQFTPLKGKLEEYHLYVLLAPHLGNQGGDNTAWLGDYKGVPMLFAQRENIALALASSTDWLKCSAGFAGVSDGWQDLSLHKQLTWAYARAENGNVTLTGELDLVQSEGNFTLALGFGSNPAEAGQRALASLLEGFEDARLIYIREWQDWLHTLDPLSPQDGKLNAGGLYEVSAAVLRTHESKHFPGGLIASLSIPWGFSKGDDDLGGYHLAWPRDLVESAGGLLAAGAHSDARRVLYYLQVTQEMDGHWPQNMWLDGRPYWAGIQMDETAFPILLVDLARRENALNADDLTRLWPMVHKAAGFLVCNGPVTAQDRWEEDPGYSPFTLAAEIAALLAAADLADLNKESEIAAYLRQTADAWNDGIDHWIYSIGTELAHEIGVEGYYVRVAPPEVADSASPALGFVPIKNRPPGENMQPAASIVSPDALALVRFGLRTANDPRILNTVKVIDTLLKIETPHGPAWHRYNDDGYGEHADGNPFDGTGMGRLWPLLTGERAHFELAAGHHEEALRLLHTLESFANEGGLIPEQIWDSPDIPEKELFFGRPSGSAMPLVWAHAEYVKLLRSLKEGCVFDMPPQTAQRYLAAKTVSLYVLWRFNHKIRSLPAGKILRVEALSPGMLHWSTDGWSTAQDYQMQDTHLGLYVADLPTQKLPPGAKVEWTFYWSKDERWEGSNFAVLVSDK
jgi:glucoamylase